MTKLILASASKGRKHLLSLLKIPYEIISSNVDEEKIIGISPLETIRLRAKLKAEEVTGSVSLSPRSPRLPRSLMERDEFFVLSADTEVIINNQLLGKPKDYKDAVRMLKTLSGKTHEVVSAYYIIRHSGEDPPTGGDDSRIPSRVNDSGQARMTYSGYDRSIVTFRKLTDNDIKIYLSLTEYTRYTGSYAVIASPHTFITKIEGSLSNVIGLPLEKVVPIFQILKFYNRSFFSISSLPPPHVHIDLTSTSI